MRLISSPQRPSTAAWSTYTATAAAVTATAVAGARAVDADSTWYKTLHKPSWQPPPWAFPAAWTPLYASIAWAAGRALNRSSGHDRAALATSIATNLTVNAGWTRVFFRRRSPWAGVAGTLLLDLSNAQLIGKVFRTDRTAAAVLAPYATWCLFATVLNVSLARHNPRRRP